MDERASWNDLHPGSTGELSAAVDRLGDEWVAVARQMEKPNEAQTEAMHDIAADFSLGRYVIVQAERLANGNVEMTVADRKFLIRPDGEWVRLI